MFTALSATCLAWCVFLTARRWGGTTAGLISAALITFHPLFLTFSLRFSSECFFILMLAVYILAWTSSDSRWKYPVMGAAAALACGARPTALLLLPAFGVFLLIRQACGKVFRDGTQDGVSVKHTLLGYTAYAAAFLLVLSPFCIRSRVSYGSWNPAGCLGGFNMFVGNNRDNVLAYRAPDGKTFLKHQNDGGERAIAFAKAMPCDLPPVEQDKRFREAAMEEIRQTGAGGFARLSAAKAWHFIRPWPLHGAHPESVFWLICLSELLLYAGGAAGIRLMREKRSALLLLLMILCVGWSAHTFVHLQMRHRVPFLDLPLVLLAGVAFGRFFQAIVLRFAPRGLRHGETVSGSSQDK